jgi:hypothetical protein
MIRSIITTGIRILVRKKVFSLINILGETMIPVFIALNLSILLVNWIPPSFNKSFVTRIAFPLSDPVVPADGLCYE